MFSATLPEPGQPCLLRTAAHTQPCPALPCPPRLADTVPAEGRRIQGRQLREWV